MELLDDTYFERVKVQEANGKELAKQCYDRFLYILSTIYKQFGKELQLTPNGITIFTDMGWKQLNVSIVSKSLTEFSKLIEYQILNQNGWRSIPGPMGIIWENNIINLERTIPGRWMSWNFEDELEDGKNEYDQKIEKERLAKIDKDMEKNILKKALRIKIKERIMEGLTPEELILLKEEKMKNILNAKKE